MKPTRPFFAALFFLTLPVYAALGAPALVPAPTAAPTAAPATGADKPYRYSTNWFSPAQEALWLEKLRPLHGKPHASYLELGVYEGRSFFWVLDHLLTHPTTKAVAVDLFAPARLAAFRKNMAVSGHAKKVTTLVGHSEKKLRTMKAGPFDLIYIDAGHEMRAVLSDFVLAWPLLKEDGFLVFDDYLWEEGRLPPDLTPRAAVDAVVTAYRAELELVHQGYQVIVRKRKSLIGSCSLCTRVGGYLYDWWEKTLRRADGEAVALDEQERATLEKLLNQGQGPFAKTAPDAPAFTEPRAAALLKKLGLSPASFGYWGR